jgi:molecular chaperone GrpE (heat shock protein)
LSDLLAEPVDHAGFAPANSDLSAVGFTALSDRLDSLQETFESLRENVRIALGRAERSDKIIDSLEAENRGLKQRESERRQEPLIKGVISLFDDLRAVTRHARTHGAAKRGEEPALLESLMVFERQAIEILRRNQVEAFEPMSTDRFDATKQEAWETVDVASQDQDMQIAEVLRIGFEFGGRVIRPAAVKVYRFRDITARGE